MCGFIQFFFLLAWPILSADSSGTQPAAVNQPTSDQSPVATVLGQIIHRWEIEVPAAECDKYRAEWKPEVFEKWLADEPGRLLSSKVWLPLMQKFISDNHLEATAQEIADFRDGQGKLKTERKQQRLKRIEQELSGSQLSEEERADLKKDLDVTRRFLKIEEEQAINRRATQNNEMYVRMARWWVETWKFNRALYQKYGGRVIFQQAGIEPLDAMQKWLEEHERAGDFEILDPELHGALYSYFYLRFHDVTQKDSFEKPWWLMEPNKEELIRFGNRREQPVPLPETTPASSLAE